MYTGCTNMKTTESAFVVYCSTELVTPWHVEARSARVAFAVAADRGTGAYSQASPRSRDVSETMAGGAHILMSEQTSRLEPTHTYNIDDIGE